MKWRGLLPLLMVITLSACGTTASSVKKDEAKETKEALKSIASAVSGQDINDQDLKNLEKQIREDEDARTAVETITNTLSGQRRIKYSPATGKRYAPHLEYDPETGVKLEYLDE